MSNGKRVSSEEREKELRGFLSEVKVDKGEPYTHTTKSTGDVSPNNGGWEPSSYFIDDEYKRDFFIRYCNAISRGIIPTITEKPTPFGPFRVDFDFKSSLDGGNKRNYNLETLRKVVAIHQEEIRKVLLSDNPLQKTLWCIVLEKPSPRVEEGLSKDGFHLHFPNFICEGWMQDEYLRTRITNRMIEERVWDKAKFVTKLEDFIDRSVSRKCWMLYGSYNYKNPKSTPYLYNRWESVPKDKQYGHVFDDKLKEVHMEELFEDEMIGSRQGKSAKYYLPIFLSIRGHPYPTQIISEISEKYASKKRRNPRRRKVNPSLSEAAYAQENIKIIKDGDIMSMISDDRADDYHEWMNIGWTLFNVGNGSDEALEMWVDFSRRSTKFVEGDCEELWDKMEIRGKTIASLLAIAKVDSPAEFMLWKEANVKCYIERTFYENKPTEYDVAMVVKKLCGENYLCSDPKKGEWFYYSQHRWREMNSATALRRVFVGELIEKYSQYRFNLGGELNDIEKQLGIMDKDDSRGDEIKVLHAKLLKKKKKCAEAITLLKTSPFHKRLVDMCQVLMEDRDFHLKKDENRYLLGCENGVIDLETLQFRDGRPDDFITFSTGINYVHYSPRDEEVIEVEEMMKKIYPNPNIREYFYDFFASCLKGGNDRKEWLIASGQSDGAKSATFKLLEHTLGSGLLGYTDKFAREIFVQSTSRNSSSGPRADLVKTKGKRLMMGQEIAKNEKINIGFIKEATGKDSFTCRNVYGRHEMVIKPQYVLVTHLNVPPIIPGDDEAFWSRISILGHESKFVINSKLEKFPVPEELEEQMKIKRFHADENFDDKIPGLAPVLLWILFERYKRNIREERKIKKPKEVLAATSSYKSNNDVFHRFITDRIEREEDEKKASKIYIGVIEMSANFKEWYKDEYPGYSNKDAICGRSTIVSEITIRLGTIEEKEDVYGWDPKKKHWKGYRFSRGEEEEGNGEEESDSSFLRKG